MKNLFKTPFLIAFLASSLFFTGCSSDGNDILSNDGDIDLPDDGGIIEDSYEIIVNATNAVTDERTVDIVADPNSTVDVDVMYTGDKAMRRIYMTKNVFSDGNGPQPFEYDLGDKKSDGSIDLDGDDKTSFDFTFTFETPENVDDVVQYVIWTTNNVGDFRDVSNSNSIADDAYGVITITAGNGATSSGFVSFSQTLLEVPLADLTSETFMSLYSGDTYLISEGVETSALWDFGYLYGTNSEAGFYSTNDFPSSGFGGTVETISGVSQDALNKCYFGPSSLTADEFDAIASSDSLNNSLTTSSSQRIQNLQINDVVEVLDQYGNRGLIKITDIDPGNGFNSSTNQPHSITFDVKVQVNAEPIVL